LRIASSYSAVLGGTTPRIVKVPLEFKSELVCREKLFGFVAIQFGESLALAKSGEIHAAESRFRRTRANKKDTNRFIS
jgi:hypothetical protein